MRKPRTPKKTWAQHPNTIEDTLQAINTMHKWEAKTGIKTGYADGIIATTEFCADLCERILALEKASK